MGHVLGIGTLWGDWNSAGTVGPAASGYPYNYNGNGAKATAVWQNDWGCIGTPPVETDGGGGTAGGHWDEGCLDKELMTGYVDSGMSLSKLTAAALDDLGYTINYASSFIDYSYTGANTSCCNGRRNLRTLASPNGNHGNPPIPEHVLSAVDYGKKELKAKQLPPGKSRTTDAGAIYVGDKLISVFFFSNGSIHTVDIGEGLDDIEETS
jgi:hypothetical protein